MYILAALVIALTPKLAYAQCDTATLQMTRDLGRQCSNAFEAHDYGGASVYCSHAAENAGVCADSENGQHRDMMLLTKAQDLVFEAMADFKMGQYDDERDLVQTAKRVLHEVLATGSTAEYRRNAKEELAQIQRLFHM